MGAGAIAMAIVVVITIGITAYLVGALLRSIGNEKKTRMRLWKNFGLSLGFCLLFFLSWVAQGIAQWQTFTDEQRQHGEPVAMGDFVAKFSQSTLENWQSEFLQLFSFTIMAAILIHKGSAESKDSDDRMQAALQRIEKKLATEPTAHEGAQDKDLHVLPDEAQGWQLRSGDSSEPEGYYDTQDEAVQAGRTLARMNNVALHIHTPEGKLRESVERN